MAPNTDAMLTLSIFLILSSAILIVNLNVPLNGIQIRFLKTILIRFNTYCILLLPQIFSQAERMTNTKGSR